MGTNADRGFPNDWRARRRAVLTDANWACQIRAPGCTHVATEVDHIVRRRDGGGHDRLNLRAACRTCNRTREGRAGGKPSRRW